MPSPSSRPLVTGCLLAALMLSGPALAQQQPPQAAPTAAELKTDIDKALYVADKARSTADKARIAGYVAGGFGLLTTLGVASLLLRRGGGAPAPAGTPRGAAGGSSLADLARLFADRRHRRLLRRQQELARTMADLSATFSLYQDQAKEVDTVMLSIREKLARLDAEIGTP